MKCLILIILSGLLIISSICFSKTKGLVLRGSTIDSLQYCTEYKDATVNDNVVIEFGKIAFLIVLLIQIIFIRKKIPIIEASIYLLASLFQTGLIFAMQSDGCSIWDTIIYTKNIPLLIYIAAFILFFIYVVLALVEGLVAKLSEKKLKEKS